VTTAAISGDPRSSRRLLAAELSRIRDQAGLSGRQLAHRIGISQSKVSRIEAGKATPSLPEVIAWADAAGTSVETRDRLSELSEASFAEVHAWRTLLRHRPHLQDDIGEREASALRVRTFQPSIIPGLLQTAEYASQVFAMFPLPYAVDDLGAAVAGRLDRQRVLHQGGRFEFLVTEAALRWRPVPRQLHIAQLERMAALSTLTSISIGLIGLDANAVTTIPHGFVIYDSVNEDSYVTVETIHAGIDITGPAEVALYDGQWSRLSDMAVFGEATRQRLAKLVTELRDGAG
jgi:transcriptional regulator with XRE-family HTH domain